MADLLPFEHQDQRMLQGFDPLPPEDARALMAYEQTIAAGLQTFVDVGQALLAIRDERLYRQTHPTFEGYCRERWGMSRIHAHRLIEAATVAENLLPMGNIPTTERQARPLTALSPDEQREVWQEAVATAPNGKVTAVHVQRVVGGLTPHVAHNTGNNEWYTPPEYIEAARRVLGTIDLDPASSAIANQTVQATRFFTAADDGLAHPWAGTVWLNPPYAVDLIGPFITKLCHHVGSAEITAALVLVNNATETIWFHAVAQQADAICFPRGRVRFLDPDGNPGAPLQGQAVLYLGRQVAAFEAAFAPFGVVLYR